MQIVELLVGRKEFGEVLGGMREWIDRAGAGPVKFESESHSSGLVMIRLEFSRADLGFAFHRDWQAEAISAAPIAA